MEMPMSTILITGCSSGFGLQTAKLFLARGWEVIATIGHLRRMRDGVEKAIRSLERSTGDFRLPGGGEADR